MRSEIFKKMLDEEVKENDLRDFIVDDVEILLNNSPYKYVDKEKMVIDGRVDIMIKVKAPDLQGRYTKDLNIVWECKGVSTYICKHEKGRTFPSDEWISAETQLLGYVLPLEGCKISYCIGGIIIGKDLNDNINNSNFDQYLKSKKIDKTQQSVSRYGDKFLEEIEKCINVRIEGLYKKNNITFLTWSVVLERIQDKYRGSFEKKQNHFFSGDKKNI